MQLRLPQMLYICAFCESDYTWILANWKWYLVSIKSSVIGLCVHVHYIDEFHLIFKINKHVMDFGNWAETCPKIFVLLISIQT